MNVYLSGPVTTGTAEAIGADEARRRFTDAARACRAKWPGCTVFDPTSKIPADADHERAMRLCLRELTAYYNRHGENAPVYDALVSLDGWKTSRGASLERMVAEQCGIACYDLCEVER